MNSTKLRFPGAFGSDLAARLDAPADPPTSYALFAHCFTCSKELKAVNRICRTLAERGIATLRFDFTGLGESDGDFADTNFSSNLEDLLAASAFLRSNYAAPKLLIGHSLGGAAVLAAAARVPECVAVATIGAPSETEHLRESLIRANPELEQQGEVEAVLAGRSFRLKQQLIDDLGAHRLRQAIGDLNRALLVMHAPGDDTVGIDHARRIFEAAKHPKSFVVLDGADHLLLQRDQDSVYAGEMLACWSSRYVGT